MPRDSFSTAVVDRLAKRVGMRCSCPDCRQPTSGPDSSSGVTNVGVAAHIAAASPGGARYDPSMSSEQRSDIANGIWLCQTHAKLVDDDELAFPVVMLQEWKFVAEQMAALEARGFEVHRARPFAELEKKAPMLLAEMREDLRGAPLVRQFIVIGANLTYNSGGKMLFRYCPKQHEYIDSIMTIMVHAGAIYSAKFNDVPRYNFTEEFVSYLLAE